MNGPGSGARPAPRWRHRTGLFALVLAITSLCASETSARDRAWYKYENPYFEVYSDASRRSLKWLLQDLERFRSALEQFGSLAMPEGAGKTRVIVFRSHDAFKKLVPISTVGAAAGQKNGTSYIAMPLNKSSNWRYRAIRHEYVHAVQLQRGSREPPWYREGFAVFMSAVRFIENDTKIVIGDHPGRSEAPGPLIDWTELISDDFVFHDGSSRVRVSNAYLQAWLLVHYLTLGDDMSHNATLMRYLRRVSAGESSIETFADLFDEPVSEMGDRVYRQYGNGFQPIVLTIDPESGDNAFERTELTDDELVLELGDVSDGGIDRLCR